MGAQLQKIATFLIGGLPELIGWIQSFAIRAQNVIDQFIIRYHGALAWAVLIGFALFILSRVVGWVWKRIPKPKAPEETVVAPKPYRLLVVCAVVAAIYLAACFSAMD